MKNEKLFFYITKYTNGNYRIETPDIRYHWRDGLLKDEVKPEKLGTVLEKMAEDALEKMDAAEGIEQIRSDALQSYLANIPFWEANSSYHNEEYAICHLATSLPVSARKAYGFEVSGYDYEDEDQFGRYTAHSTTIVYNGKTYHC